MEVPLTGESAMKHENSSTRQKGGLRTMPFILVNDTFEKVASFGLLPNMILYLLSDYHISVALGTNVLLIWSAATNFLPIVGAFLSDSLLGRFLTIFLGSIFSLMGMILLWLTTILPNAKPPPCDLRVPKSCQSPTPVQYSLLFSAFALMSIGAGGIRPCSLAFGADQIECKDNPKREDHHGWRVGFGIPVVLMLISTISFIVAYPLYYKMKVEKSLFTNLCQVVSAAWKNRKVTLPDSSGGSWYYTNDTKVVTLTKNL
ncbi:NRT1/ PTR family 1.2-like protein, partial [Tanacetum coccineum]